MKIEYRNAKKIENIRPRYITYYECDLYINEVFSQHITLSDSQYRENMLILKLETMLDKETLDEVKEVFFLKYEEGASDGADSHF